MKLSAYKVIPVAAFNHDYINSLTSAAEAAEDWVDVPFECLLEELLPLVAEKLQAGDTPLWGSDQNISVKTGDLLVVGQYTCNGNLTMFGVDLSTEVWEKEPSYHCHVYHNGTRGHLLNSKRWSHVGLSVEQLHDAIVENYETSGPSDMAWYQCQADYILSKGNEEALKWANTEVWRVAAVEGHTLHAELFSKGTDNDGNPVMSASSGLGANLARVLNQLVLDGTIDPVEYNKRHWAIAQCRDMFI